MNTARAYDPELQMFRESGREPDLAELRFLRWLAEQGRLETTPLGPPAGRYVERPPSPRRRLKLAT
jgi:hypothetical protein